MASSCSVPAKISPRSTHTAGRVGPPQTKRAPHAASAASHHPLPLCYLPASSQGEQTPASLGKGPGAAWSQRCGARSAGKGWMEMGTQPLWERSPNTCDELCCAQHPPGKHTDGGGGRNHNFPLHPQWEKRGGNLNPQPRGFEHHPVPTQGSPPWMSSASHTGAGLTSGMWESGFGYPHTLPRHSDMGPKFAGLHSTSAANIVLLGKGFKGAGGGEMLLLTCFPRVSSSREGAGRAGEMAAGQGQLACLQP